MASATGGKIVKRLPPLPTIRDIIKLYKLRAMRQLSQNFLLNNRLNDKIVKCATDIQDGEVLEVGPGPGNITRSILRQEPSKIILIEKDTRFLPSLQMLAEASSIPIQIMNADILHMNMEKMFSKEMKREWDDFPPNIHLIGNLPFNISTPLIIRWIREVSERSSAWSFGRVRMTLTFQKEVAERIAAPILSSQRSRISLVCQNWCQVEHKFIIPGCAFIPKPKVDVSVVHLTPLKTPLVSAPFPIFEKVARHLFKYRQKHSIKGIQTLFPLPVREELAKRMYDRADINPQVRPYQLTIPEIGRLIKEYTSILEEQPLYVKYDTLKNKTDTDWLNLEYEEEKRAQKWREENLKNIDF